MHAHAARHAAWVKHAPLVQPVHDARPQHRSSAAAGRQHQLRALAAFLIAIRILQLLLILLAARRRAGGGVIREERRARA